MTPDGNRRGSPQVFTSERANSWTSYHAACNTGQVSCVTIQMKRMNAVSPGLSWDFLDHQAGSWVASATFNEPEVLLPQWSDNRFASAFRHVRLKWVLLNLPSRVLIQAVHTSGDSSLLRLDSGTSEWLTTFLHVDNLSESLVDEEHLLPA